MGYPVLDVQCKSRTDNSITLTIRQSKFRANAGKEANDGVMPTWMIPVSFSTPASPHDPVKSILIENTETEVTVDNVPRNGWVKVNPGTYGFYRVRYSSDLLSALLPAVRDQTLHPRDRLALQSDIFALASSGLVPTTDYLKTLSAYENETNYTVWNDVNGKVGSLFTLLWNNDDAHEQFKKFSLKLFKKISDRLGWVPATDEGHLDSMLRSLVIGRMGKCGCEETLTESQNRFSSHVSKSNPVIADLRAAVYGNVVAHGGKKDLETMLTLHKDTDLHEERNRIERCLGYISDDELMKEVLDFAMSERVRDNDRVFVIAALATCHKRGRNMAWEFTKNNWEKLHAMYKGQFLIARLVKTTTENFSDEAMAKDVQEFFEKNRADAAERTVQQSLEQIKQKSDWWKRDGEAITGWLKENV